jgi:hypothetical protein
MTDHTEYMKQTNDALKRFPGDPEIIENAIGYSEHELDQGRPVNAAEMMRICVLNAADSTYLSRLKELLSLALDWQAARRSASVGSLLSAADAMKLHKSEMMLVCKNKALDDLKEWFEKAKKSKDLAAAESLAEVIKSFSYFDDYKPQVEALKKAIQEEQERQEIERQVGMKKVLADTLAAWQASTWASLAEKKSALETILGQARLDLGTVGETNPGRPSFQDQLSEIEGMAGNVTGQIEAENAAATARQLESQASSLSGSTDEKELAQAVALYTLVSHYYEKAGQADAAASAKIAASGLQRASEYLKDVTTQNDRAESKLKRLEADFKVGPPDYLSTLLKQALIHLGQSLNLSREARPTAALVDQAREYATRLGWEEAYFKDFLARTAVADLKTEEARLTFLTREEKKIHEEVKGIEISIIERLDTHQKKVEGWLETQEKKNRRRMWYLAAAVLIPLLLVVSLFWLGEWAYHPSLHLPWMTKTAATLPPTTQVPVTDTPAVPIATTPASPKTEEVTPATEIPTITLTPTPVTPIATPMATPISKALIVETFARPANNYNDITNAFKISKGTIVTVDLSKSVDSSGKTLLPRWCFIRFDKLDTGQTEGFTLCANITDYLIFSQITPASVIEPALTP